MVGAVVARLAVMWMGILVLFYLQSTMASLLFGPGYSLSGHIVMACVATVLTVPLVIVVRRRWDRQSLAGLGLAINRSALASFAIGALAWLLPFAISTFGLVALGLVTITTTAPLAEILAFVPLLICLVFLLEALPEELVFRGYIQTNLMYILPPWAAVAVQAILFGTWGVALWLLTAGGVDVLHASLFYVMGAIFGMLRTVTGSVWTSVGFHLAFQTMAQLLLNAERGHFVVDNPPLLQLVALGILPFSLAMPIVELFFRNKVDWRQRPAHSTIF